MFAFNLAAVVFILTHKQMQVSQPLTYSDLGVYNKISDFGILAKQAQFETLLGYLH